MIIPVLLNRVTRMKKVLFLSTLMLVSFLVTAQEYSARYRLTFVADWRAASHPIDFPVGAHFSPLVGNTHNDNGFIWQAGGIATPGIEDMAETGGTFALNNEIDALIHQGHGENRINGSGVGGAGMTSVEFDISYSHPRFSLVTMIAPSPDWFIGVHGVSLLENQHWIDEMMIDLLPYDSGTDSGASFTSSNADVMPHEPIRRISENPLPDDVPLGVFFLERLSITGTSPDDVFSSSFE